MAPMMEPMMPLVLSQLPSPRPMRLARKPPMNEPTTPRTMVCRMPMLSLPGTTARAMKPAIAPMMIMVRMKPSTVCLLR